MILPPINPELSRSHSIMIIVNLRFIKILFCIRPLYFSLASQCNKVQDCIPIRYSEQASYLLIGGFPSSGPIADMYPAGSKVILFGGKQDIRRGYCSVFDPELTPVQLNHYHNNGIGSYDLGAPKAFAICNITNGRRIPYHYIFNRPVSKGTGCRQCCFHNLINDVVINVFVCISSYGTAT